MQLGNDENSPATGGGRSFPSRMRLRISTDSTPASERAALLWLGIARTGYHVRPGAHRDGAALSWEVDICAAGGLSLSSMTTNLIDVARTGGSG